MVHVKLSLQVFILALVTDLQRASQIIEVGLGDEFTYSFDKKVTGVPVQSSVHKIELLQGTTKFFQYDFNSEQQFGSKRAWLFKALGLYTHHGSLKFNVSIIAPKVEQHDYGSYRCIVFYLEKTNGPVSSRRSTIFELRAKSQASTDNLPEEPIDLWEYEKNLGLLYFLVALLSFLLLLMVGAALAMAFLPPYLKKKYFGQGRVYEEDQGESSVGNATTVATDTEVTTAGTDSLPGGLVVILDDNYITSVEQY